ncbi:sugar nucleotidyltransferase [Evansella tamaricis]|uniref:Glucose-1-phosphate thymidylyltransferase n=1 Tax=Evansella tamaricis TaxID=2069301 RepID=A0ABS6JI17_9BACI|nr:sugar phosphate nucleotidyltransferase [Evansella tamaricis]MBU9713292.1 NTP transferase domain-containing protein [Evansella tamaricis]
MIGVILAGGSGSRLRPFTKIINKHFLPVGRHPMIIWPLLSMKKAGMERILIVSNLKDIPFFQSILEDYSFHKNMKVSFVPQSKPLGIAHALLQVESYVKGEKLFVILGDNIFTESVAESVKLFEQGEEGAKLFLKEVYDPGRFGIAKLDENNHPVEIIEKPAEPTSNLCVTGIYLFNHEVFDFIKEIKPSNRGELEITDINQLYLKHSTVSTVTLKDYWMDAGTMEALQKTSQYMFSYEKSCRWRL